MHKFGMVLNLYIRNRILLDDLKQDTIVVDEVAMAVAVVPLIVAPADRLVMTEREMVSVLEKQDRSVPAVAVLVSTWGNIHTVVTVETEA